MTFSTYRFVFCLATTLFESEVASGERNWPEFRGPTAQGVSSAKNLPLHWSAAQGKPETNIVWKAAIQGEGWSSPALQDDKIYITSAVAGTEDRGLSLQALCLNAKDGSIVWQKPVFPQAKTARIHGKNGNASPTPIVEQDRVYVHFGHMGTACLNLDGGILWKNTELAYTPVHGNGGSPVLVEDLLVFSCDGDDSPFVVALSKADGKIRWKTTRMTDAKKKFSFCTPTVIEVRGRKQIIIPGSGAVCAYDPKDGAEIWRARYGEGYSVVPRPVFAHGLLFIATGYDRPTVFAVKPDGKGDVTDTHVAWTITRGAPNTPSLLVVEDRLYMISDAGILTCLEALTGKELWQERIGGNFSSSPMFGQGRIYLQSEEGVGTVVDSGKTFKILARNDMGERSLASYAAADGALFVRTALHLFRIGAVK